MSGMFRELRADEIECRISQICMTGKNKGIVLLLYKDARCDANILDETVGCDNWQNEYYECKGTLFCKVGVRINDTWIWKSDAGSPSNTEAIKGEASDAFKRASFKFGLGRELYTAPFIWVPENECNVSQGNDGRWRCYDRFSVKDIQYEGGKIVKLLIENAKTHAIVYQLGDYR